MSFANYYCLSGSTGALRRALLSALVAIGAATPHAVWADHSHHGRGFGMFMMSDPGKVAHKIDHVLAHLNATDEQRTNIKRIVQAAAADLKEQRVASMALHERALQLFTQTNVDEVAVETLRQQMVQQVEQSSRRVTLAMLEVSRVLSLEQRTKLAEHMKRRHEMRKRHGRERSDVEAH